jgi:hypothetical protein
MVLRCGHLAGVVMSAVSVAERRRGRASMERGLQHGSILRRWIGIISEFRVHAHVFAHSQLHCSNRVSKRKVTTVRL